MLSDRISLIFNVLGCGNPDIARCADCSASYIRLIHANKRGYAMNSKAISLLVHGIYNYADKEYMLDTLVKLCQAPSSKREELTPAIISWLFNSDKLSIQNIKSVPKKKRKEKKNRSFGEKLDSLMQLLGLSNARLARSINVDGSYISRFRGGVRSPIPGSEIASKLVEVLYRRAIEQSKISELSRITKVHIDLFETYESGITSLSAWLYESNDSHDAMAINRLLEYIDSFSVQTNSSVPELSSLISDDIVDSDKLYYYGIDGMREAVLRFLSNTALEGGELWLYSDESIDWMVADKVFFAKWSALMFACVNRGVHVKIIHNIDRIADEMISAIESWMPLYMSGMIESYLCRRVRDSRFSHTLFLRPGSQCISAFHIRGQEKTGVYEYITEASRLKPIMIGLDDLFSQSELLVRIHRENLHTITASMSASPAYHLYTSPKLPFDDIQIATNEKRVVVIKSSSPSAAFVFTEPTMLLAFHDYFDKLMQPRKA